MKIYFYKLFLILFIFSFQKTSAQFFQESFENGLPADWSAVMEAGNGQPFSNWVYTTSGPSGPYSTDPLNSSSSSDGWMMFDSDKNCNPAGVQDVWLISPLIDCTGKSEVHLSFEAYYVRFNDFTSIEVSVDGQQNWTSFPIYEDLMNNEFAGGDESVNPFFTTLDISSVAANESEVQFAFRFRSDPTTVLDPTFPTTGCAYNWQIDEVGLYEENPLPTFDMQILDFFFAVPPNAQIPSSQLEPIHFLADIKNSGGMPTTNVQLNIVIEETASGMEVFRDTIDYPDMQPGEVQENRIFEKSWVPDSAVEMYTGKYMVFMDEVDLVANNNTTKFNFSVTDSVFAKDFMGAPVAFSPDDSTDWSIAAHYFVPNGTGFKLTSVQFGVGNPSAVSGGTVEVYLYEWEDQNNDKIAQANERGINSNTGNIIAHGTHIIDGNSDLVKMPLTNWTTSTDQIPLEDNTHYLLAVHLQQVSGNNIPIKLVATKSPDYLAMAFLLDSLNIPRFNAFLNETESDISADLFPFSEFNPVLRMHINPIGTIIHHPKLSEKTVEVFPNPANSSIQLEFRFLERKDKVDVDIFHLNGAILERKLENIKNEKILLDISNLTPGTYFINIKTREGMLSKKMVIMK